MPGPIDQRDRLTAIVKDDVKRLDRLITDISDASRLDAELARGRNHPVDMRRLLETVISLANETRSPGLPEIRLELGKLPKGVDSESSPYRVLGHDNRLAKWSATSSTMPSLLPSRARKLVSACAAAGKMSNSALKTKGRAFGLKISTRFSIVFIPIAPKVISARIPASA